MDQNKTKQKNRRTTSHPSTTTTATAKSGTRWIFDAVLRLDLKRSSHYKAEMEPRKNSLELVQLFPSAAALSILGGPFSLTFYSCSTPRRVAHTRAVVERGRGDAHAVETAGWRPTMVHSPSLSPPHVLTFSTDDVQNDATADDDVLSLFFFRAPIVSDRLSTFF